MSIQRKSLLRASTAAFVLLPGAALAEVTPADVWNNLQAMNRATGAEVSADISESGGVMTVTDMVIEWTLPMGVGNMSFDYGDLTLTAQGDGTVAITTPESDTLSMRFDIPEAGSGTVSMGYSAAGYSTIASGAPGDISYAYSIDRVTVTMGEMTLEGPIAEEADGFVLDGIMAFDGMVGTYQITEGELIKITSDGDFASGKIDISYEAAVEGEEPIGTRSTATLGEMSADIDIAVPASGVSLMALPAALRSGLSMTYDFTSGPQISSQETYLGDELIMSQSTNVGSNDGSFTFDASGIRFAGTATDYDLSLMQPLVLPFPIAAAMSSVEADMQIPLLASDAAQTAVIKMILDGLTIDPALWSLFDPGAQLSREPASLAIDVTTTLDLLLDLLDFEALAGIEQSGEMPAEFEAVTINSLAVQAAGAAASVVGGFTLDNSDLETFDGFPAPTGSATVTLTNAEALLQTLVEMGLLTPEDMMGANMVLGGFFRPGDGATERVSEIVIDGASGAISANGQRLR